MRFLLAAARLNEYSLTRIQPTDPLPPFPPGLLAYAPINDIPLLDFQGCYAPLAKLQYKPKLVIPDGPMKRVQRPS